MRIGESVRASNLSSGFLLLLLVLVVGVFGLGRGGLVCFLRYQLAFCTLGIDESEMMPVRVARTMNSFFCGTVVSYTLSSSTC